VLDWLERHQAWLGWLGAGSLFVFVASLLTLPWILARVPIDYFTHRPTLLPWPHRPMSVRVAAFVVKNAVGALLVAAGLAMLVLPGQGLLTIAVGLMLMNFPGKRALELGLARRPRIVRAMDWMRARAGAPPLDVARRD
jgi:hypothetical protein